MDGGRVSLLWVEGEDAGEFSDVVGTSGKLILLQGDGLVYMPGNHGDFVQLSGGVSKTDDKGRTRVTTELGNTFVFRRDTTTE